VATEEGGIPDEQDKKTQHLHRRTRVGGATQLLTAVVDSHAGAGAGDT